MFLKIDDHVITYRDFSTDPELRSGSTCNNAKYRRHIQLFITVYYIMISWSWHVYNCMIRFKGFNSSQYLTLAVATFPKHGKCDVKILICLVVEPERSSGSVQKSSWRHVFLPWNFHIWKYLILFLVTKRSRTLLSVRPSPRCGSFIMFINIHWGSEVWLVHSPVKWTVYFDWNASIRKFNEVSSMTLHYHILFLVNFFLNLVIKSPPWECIFRSLFYHHRPRNISRICDKELV